MELKDEGLSTTERALAGELVGLGVNPSPEKHAAIMAAVRRSQSIQPSVIGRWRPALVALVAAALLVLSSVGAVAASSDAVPSSPTYSLRIAGEQTRLAFASPAGREQLRIAFANARINQALAVLKQGDRADVRGLLRDSRGYLAQVKKDLAGLPANEQGQIQNQLNQAEANEHQAEEQLNQSGAEGQS
ncbi:MAG: hypothetical protein NVS9B11_23510 [Candidatus Dormibacteraceae bacterium]